MFPKLLIAVMILYRNLGQRDPFSLPEGKPGTKNLPKWPCCQQYVFESWYGSSITATYRPEVMGVYDRVGMKNGRPFYRKLDDPTLILSFDDVSTAWHVAQILPIQNPPIRDPPRGLPELQNPPIQDPPRRLPELQNPPRRNPPKRHPSIQNLPIQNPPSGNLPRRNPPKSSRRNLLFQNPPAKIHPSNSTRTLRQFSPRQNPAESFSTRDEIHPAPVQSSFHAYPILWAANTELCPDKDSWQKWWMNYNSHEPTPFTNSMDVYTCNGEQQTAVNGESE